MPDKFNLPTDPLDALYHAVLCGEIEKVKKAIRESPELIRGRSVIDGAWSHGGRRCAAEDDVIECLWLISHNGADFTNVGVSTIDSAYKTFPRAARVLFHYGANAKAADDDGFTALHRMVEIGYRTAAQDLLSHGADIQAKSENGETPLDVAVRLRLPRMTQFLLENGGKPNLTTPDANSIRAAETKVETLEGRMKGEVAWFRADRGYGYLRDQSTESGELFFDAGNVVGQIPVSVEDETDVTFKIVYDRFGRRADQVEFGKTDHHLHAYCGDTGNARLTMS